ncbi:hypothetical protein NAV33_07505 [Pseudomonas stutzeri]|uniref:hypothetical protein n=1 Tax=Stutzerimonas stutzeri TaxID=316 RepID=UPI00210D795C|nr:hypothetical protein [Stutzerimonas stutzeri]MCQ4311741.1 hypothetical protein [Stutzerimonas stutzeri]
MKTKAKTAPSQLSEAHLTKWRALLTASAEQIEALQTKLEMYEQRQEATVEKELFLLEKLIAAEERVEELNSLLAELADPDNQLVVVDPVHLNPADQLPPVACPLLIHVEGELIRAERTAFIASRERAMVYQLEDGRRIEGRFPWTYP